MKKYILATTLLFCVYLVSAQNYIPTLVSGKTWHIYKPMGLGQSIQYYFKLDCDTSINNLNYFKYFYCDTFGNKTMLNGLFREDTFTHQVFEYHANQDKLILDYNYQVGDTLLGMDVDSVKVENILGAQRKVIYFDDSYRWIEGIGISFFGLKNIPSGLNSFGFINNVYYTDADCIPLITQNQIKNNLQFLQLGNQIKISTQNEENLSIHIYNELGQKIYEENCYQKCQIMLPKHSTQFLFVEVRSKSIQKVYKIIVIN